jgi:zinc transporter, ZIP family
MLEAAGWGLVGGASLLIGAVIGARVDLRSRMIGLVLAFGAGTLVSALTFELTDEAYVLGGADAVAGGLALGALTFFLGDSLIDRRGGEMRMSHTGEQSEGSGRALLLGAVLDGIPESAVIGITLLSGEGIGIAVVAAVFLSNLPEGLSSSTGLRRAGHSPGRILRVWFIVVLVCGVSAAAGYGLLDGASGNTIGLLDAFAAGAVLTQLSDVIFPEALRHGGKAAGLATTLGFAVAFVLTTLD